MGGGGHAMYSRKSNKKIELELSFIYIHTYIHERRPGNQTIMQPIRLTPLNVDEYAGRMIRFKHGKNFIVKRIERVSNGRKTITIDYPELQNNLQIVSRKIVIV